MMIMKRTRLATLTFTATLFAGLALPALAQAPAAGTVPIGVRLMFFALDTNGDGAIDRVEGDAFIDRLFTTLDRDGSGALTLAELEGLRANLAPGVAPDDLGAVFAKFDADGKGTVSPARFRTVARGHFAWLDRDGDGRITLTDLAGRDLTMPVAPGLLP